MKTGTSNKLTHLARRREYLVAQVAAQRIALGQSIAPWRTPLALADQGLAALRFVRSHPAWIVGGGALLVTLRPGLVLKWLPRAWAAWQIAHKLRAS